MAEDGAQPELLCKFCRGEHELLECPEFLKMDIKSRCHYTVRYKRCILCLKSVTNCTGHLTPETSVRCTICNGDGHHTVMHSAEFVPPEEREGIDEAAAVNHQGGVEPYVLQECPNCLGEHLIFNCHEFQGLSPGERFLFCLQKKICIVCLKANKICRNSCAISPNTTCDECQSLWHHTLLHDPDQVPLRRKGKNQQRRLECARCNAQHHLYECAEFILMKEPQRTRVVQDHQICPLCLGRLQDCKTRCHLPGSAICLICQSPNHHELLHPDVFEFGIPTGTTRTVIQRCPQCAGGHNLTACLEFIWMSGWQKKHFCANRFICPRCLLAKDRCQDACAQNEKLVCSHCQSPFHHTFLHFALQGQDDPQFRRKKSCPQCKEEHRIHQCPLFLSLSAQAREVRRKELGLCRACLKNPHGRSCAHNICAVCGSPDHHTKLHISVDEPLEYTSGASHLKRLKLDNLLQNQATQIFRGPSTSSGPPVNNLPPITSDMTPEQKEWFSRHYVNTARVLESASYSEALRKGTPQAFITQGDLTEALRAVGRLVEQTVRPVEEPEVKKAAREREPIELRKCPLCLQPRHTFDRCPDFVSAGLQRRIRLLEIYNACARCLDLGHRFVECVRPRKVCGFHGCQLNHHPLLHRTKWDPHLSHWENEEKSVALDKVHREYYCQICISNNHVTDACPCWPPARNDRLAEARYLGLCLNCLQAAHEEDHSTCPCDEQVCGVNGCPYSHHPILHPTRVQPQYQPNRPCFEDRFADENIDSNGPFRVKRDVTPSGLRRLVNDHFSGATCLKLENRSSRDEIIYRRFKRRRDHVVLDNATFCRLYEIYRRARPGMENEPAHNSAEEWSSDDDQEPALNPAALVDARNLLVQVRANNLAVRTVTTAPTATVPADAENTATSTTNNPDAGDDSGRRSGDDDEDDENSAPDTHAQGGQDSGKGRP